MTMFSILSLQNKQQFLQKNTKHEINIISITCNLSIMQAYADQQTILFYDVFKRFNIRLILRPGNEVITLVC